MATEQSKKRDTIEHFINEYFDPIFKIINDLQLCDTTIVQSELLATVINTWFTCVNGNREPLEYFAFLGALGNSKYMKSFNTPLDTDILAYVQDRIEFYARIDADEQTPDMQYYNQKNKPKEFTFFERQAAFFCDILYNETIKPYEEYFAKSRALQIKPIDIVIEQSAKFGNLYPWLTKYYIILFQYFDEYDFKWKGNID